MHAHAFLLSLLMLLGLTECFVLRSSPVISKVQSLSHQLYAEKGTVKWFDSTKGFGFIAPLDDSGDVFVHQTSIQMEGFRSLAEGEQVEYVVELDNSGRKRAMDVTGPDGAPPQGASNSMPPADEWQDMYYNN